MTSGTTHHCVDFIERSGHAVLISHHLLNEFAEVVRRKKMLSDPEQQLLLISVRERAEFVSPDPMFSGICRDPDDDHVLACAVQGHADIILSGDEDLLTLHSFRGVRILSPREFLNEFASLFVRPSPATIESE